MKNKTLGNLKKMVGSLAVVACMTSPALLYAGGSSRPVLVPCQSKLPFIFGESSVSSSSPHCRNLMYPDPQCSKLALLARVALGRQETQPDSYDAEKENCRNRSFLQAPIIREACIGNVTIRVRGTGS